jgi:2-methylaconitate cis-trans-isomerase PrpF
VEKADADLLVRALSSGDFHATIPGTTLGALNLEMGTKGTVIHDLVSSSSPPSSFTGESDNDRVVTVRAAHAAGVAESSVRFEGGKPQSVVMLRTAREIMRGEVLVPERVFWEQ